MEVRTQGLSIIEDFLILELGNFDVIMGLQWLERLGEITTNWKEQLMRFYRNKELVELRGDPSLGVTQISLMAMERISRKEKQGMIIEVNQITTLPTETHTEPPLLSTTHPTKIPSHIL